MHCCALDSVVFTGDIGHISKCLIITLSEAGCSDRECRDATEVRSIEFPQYLLSFQAEYVILRREISVCAGLQLSE